MAGNSDVNQPLLHDHSGGDQNPPPPPPEGAPRRFRRCRTAPSSEPPPPDNNPSSTAAPPPAKTLITGGGGGRPSFRLVGLLLAAYLLVGTAAFYLAMDHMSGTRTSRLLDALYFSVVTMTTVGYGDLVPTSDAAKLLASAFAFAGVALVGTFLSQAADYLVDKQQSLLFRALHTHRPITKQQQPHDGGEARMEMKNKVRYKLYTAGLLLAGAVAAGTAVLCHVEGMRPLDAFYCVCATVTTVGYGDRSFTTEAGRAFAAAWVTVSTVVVALFFLYAAELYTERRRRELARWVLRRGTTAMDLEAADLDGDRRVGAADFVLYKLKELGKINQEEISEFLEEFDKLDADHSGTLSPSDLAVAQAQPPEQQTETG